MGHRHALALAFLVLASVAGCGGGDEGSQVAGVVRSVPPGSGVDAFQVMFWNPQTETSFTSWGRLRVDPAQLLQSTGIQGGWLNVATEQGWAVVNLPVPPASEGPFAVYFDLGLAVPAPLQQIALHVKHSTGAFGGIADHLDDAAMFPVAAAIVDAEGWGPDLPTEPGPPPAALSLAAQLPTPSDVTGWTQMLTNVQCAQDQCGPMAAANAMQYLEDMGVWTVPHVHDMGRDHDATLVGQLDWWMVRGSTSRAVGTGIGPDDLVVGVLRYVEDNALTGILTYRYQDEGFGSTLPTADLVAHGSTALYDGAMPTWAWIRDRVREGCGVVVGFTWGGGGGHMVRVTGAKTDSSGNEWIRYAHDRIQTGGDPTDSLGLETVWARFDDLDGDGIPNLGAVGTEVRIVFACCP